MFPLRLCRGKLLVRAVTRERRYGPSGLGINDDDDDDDDVVLFFSRPRSEGWPHHGRTFSIYPCPLSF